MDTEAFLLSRRAILQRMDARRDWTVLRQKQASGIRLLGVPWSTWARVLSGGLREADTSRWFIQWLLPTLVPAALAFVKSKTDRFKKEKSFWSAISGLVFSLLPYRR